MITIIIIVAKCFIRPRTEGTLCSWWNKAFGFIPREARPKASRSGVYNFVPERAQAG